MYEHLCQNNDLSVDKLNQLLSMRSKDSAAYRCGSCLSSFDTICVLHQHCKKHSEGGSYYFDHITNTAHPKFDSKCSYAQVDYDLDFEDCQDYKSIIKAYPRSINESPQLDERLESEDNGGKIQDTVCDVGTDREDSNKNFTKVTVKNVIRTSNGLVSFEMNEKDSHLFNATATVIMEQLQLMGHALLETTEELQVMVPSNGNSSGMKNNAQIEIFTGTSQSGDNPALPERKEETKDDTEIEQGANCKDKNTDADSYVSELPFINWKELQATRHTELCDTDYNGKIDKVQDEPMQLDCSKSQTNELPTNIKPELIVSTILSTNARPVRNRKPNSRLCTNEWETPTKVKRELKSKIEMKHRYKKCNSEEIINQVRDQSESADEVKKQRKDGVVVMTDEASSDDITASKVLLSLSKGRNKKTDANDMRVEHKKVISAYENHRHLEPSSVRLSNDSTEFNTGMRLRDRKNNYVVKNEINEEIGDDSMKMAYINEQGIVTKNEDRSMQGQGMGVHSGIVGGRNGDKASGGNTVGGGKKDFMCKICGKMGSKAMIEYHKQAHRKDLPFKCEVCDKRFRTKPCFSAHMKQHGERKHKCDQCSAAFFRKQYLDTHKRKHTGEVPYMCDLCGSGFMEFYILQRHINNKHKQKRNYECDICGLRFFRADTRDNHRNRHYEPTLKCAYCTKMFKAELDRRKHEMTHTGEKQFFCPLCNYGFAQLWSYYRHMWKKHETNKEEAKEIRIKNSDIVFMRNRNVDYQSQDKPVTGPREPVYAVAKRVVKTDNRHTEKTENGSKLEGLVYEAENVGYELVDSHHLELEGQSDIYEDTTNQASIFVDNTDITDAIVLQDGQSMEERGTLLPGEGHTVEATTNISIVLDDAQSGSNRGLVVLSDYSQSGIEEYAKQYSAEDI